MTVNRINRIPKIILLVFAAGIVSMAVAFAQENNKDKKPDSPDILMEMKDPDSTEESKTEKADKETEKKVEKKEKPAPDKKSKEASKAEESEDNLEEKKGPQFKFKGLAKNLYTFHETDNYVEKNPFATDHRNLSADLVRLRLSPEFLYSDIVNIKVDYDNELIGSNYGNSMYFKSYWRPFQYNDFLHIAWEPYRGDNIYYRTKIHRAYVKVSVNYFTATVGRQQIRFGSGKLWNPLDILNPISPTFVEGSDDQKGTDAVKLDFFPDEKTEISIVYDMKKSNDKINHFNMKDCNYIVRAKTSIKDTDIAVLGGYVTRRGVAGFDFAAILFDGMFRGSMIVSQGGDPYYEKEDTRYNIRYMIPGRDERFPVYFQANVGYEYTFKKGVYFLFEYFYNQRALNYNKDLKLAYTSSMLNSMDQKTYLQLANQFLTTNQHYLALALGYDFHPLVRGEFFTIGDIQGQGIFWSPALKINAYENLDFTVGVMGAFVFNKKTSDFSEFRKNYLFYASGTYVF